MHLITRRDQFIHSPASSNQSRNCSPELIVLLLPHISGVGVGWGWVYWRNGNSDIMMEPDKMSDIFYL